MGANRFNGFSRLGVGIGLRNCHWEEILKNHPQVGWFEIISENFLADGGRPMRVLEQVLESYPVVQHGVSLYFGSLQKPGRDHTRRLKSLVRKTRTPWLTDHLCWGSVDGTYSHALLPLPYTHEAARLAARHIRETRDYLETPIAIENISTYLTFRESEMTEWEFLTEVAEQADCGILLDVNNIYVSARNNGYDPRLFLESIPHERVAQIHVAGHMQARGYLLDTHDHPVKPAVWELYARAIELCGPTPTLLEWDDRIPPLGRVLEEASKALRYWPAREAAA